MNIVSSFHVLGAFLLYLSVVLIVPIPFSLYYGDHLEFSFLTPSLVALGLGLLFYFSFKPKEELGIREGFGLVAGGWLAFCIFGAIPYYLSGLAQPVDAMFESISGFTTTGATIFSGLDQFPKSILLWRALSQWLGGMGIIVLSLAILPFLGVGGMQLYQAEVAGPTKKRLSPRIQETARLLWRIYYIFTLTLFLLLWGGGMSPFDAICHSFTTMASGGFSNYDASIGHFQNSFIHWVIIGFMFLTGINFTLHYQALRGKPYFYFRSEEFVFYTLLALSSVVVLTFFNLSGSQDIGITLRDSTFQAISILSTTGYASADYEAWAPVAQVLLVSLMFIGGCGGSTSGGTKCIRIFVVLKNAILEIFHLIHPKGVKSLKVDHKPVSDRIVQSVMVFLLINVFMISFGAILLSSMGLSVVTSFSASIAAILNIGPALGSVGPAENYSHLPDLAKMILATFMLTGRLEIYTILVLFLPSFWRR